MDWLNPYGLVFMTVIMIPNIIFAIKSKNRYKDKWRNKTVEFIEQVGRFGCFGFMIIDIPGMCFGWWSEKAFKVYLIVDALLVSLYCVIWLIYRRKNTVFKVSALSAVPAAVFLFSGVIRRSVLLILTALLFAPAHILISCKNLESWRELQ